eukprot:g6835.t1
MNSSAEASRFDEDLRALEELPWSAAGRSRGRQEDAGKGKKGPKGHGKKGQAKGKGKTGKAGAWAKDLEDEHVRSIVQDLPAEAAGRRRRQQSDLLMSEAAAGRAFLQALEESLLKHAEMERRRGELVDRAQRRHERLSLLAEEAQVMLMELRQPVLLATPRISSPQRRVSASQGQGQGLLRVEKSHFVRTKWSLSSKVRAAFWNLQAFRCWVRWTHPTGPARRARPRRCDAPR